ncbi:unnamed protein product [Gongylonema pulchrum]|uniref:Tudor domain-containing protein n=1 Tax=Gongylonema pulchrum TaxID=637853 RepID=A0A183CZQ0_9BILA|nr:unnamed protein product [Gongylonema pulchrum]
MDAQELRDQSNCAATKLLPKIAGFHFSRPPPQLQHPQPQFKEGSKVFMPVPIPAPGLPRGDDFYVSVDDHGNARVYQLVRRLN